jgi:hypothetical protein
MMPVNKDSMYPYIWAWGKRMGSNDYYMENEEELAAQEEAPRTAIFRDSEGVWSTVDEVQNIELKVWLHDFVHLNFKADLGPNTETAPGKVTNPEHRADLIRHEELKPEEDRDDDS